MGLAVFPDGILDALDSTHIHSFPFVVMMGLRVAAALVRLEVEDMALDHTGIPLDFDFPALLAYEGGLIPVLGVNTAARAALARSFSRRLTEF